MFENPYMVIKKKACLEQNISTGSIHASFHNFHNVSIYIRQITTKASNGHCKVMAVLSSLYLA